MGRLNITFSTGQVLQALALGYHYGFDIMDATGLPSGTVYPILRRLDGEGLVQSRWEKQAEAQRELRPPRRYYTITATGQTMLDAAVQRHPLLPQTVGREVRGLKPSRA
jgi:DNA-binding PadR family transcriptional regulator